MIVDAHVHIERKEDGSLYSSDEIVAAMDEAGIDVSIVFGNDQADAVSRMASDAGENSGQMNFSVEEAAKFCAGCPERLFFVTSVHPTRERPEREVRRAVELFGAKGVKLYPHSGFTADDRRLYPVYEYCQEAKVPVIIHTGFKAVRWQRMKYNNPVNADDVATDFPELQLALCHCGYPWTEEFMAVAASNPNVAVDICFLDYVEDKFAIPGFVESCMRRLKKIVGAKRMIWGSEGPFMKLPLFGCHGPEYLRRCQERLVKRFDFLSEEDKRDILGENAKRMFLDKKT